MTWRIENLLGEQHAIGRNDRDIGIQRGETALRLCALQAGGVANVNSQRLRPGMYG